jgi:hypothetical protein
MDNLENSEVQERLLNPPIFLFTGLLFLGFSIWLIGVVLDIASVPLSSLTLIQIAKILLSAWGVFICLHVAWVCYGLQNEALSGIRRQKPNYIYYSVIFLTYVLTPSVMVLIYSTLSWVDLSKLL